MRFSLFFEMQISNPTRQSEYQLFHDCVDQAVLAEEVGFDGIWAVEHHGLYEYAHSSAPEIFLSYVAAKTKRINICHGVTLLPKAYNHPIRIAERVATLDILSEGRVFWGTGKSGTRVELSAFGIDPDELDEQWLEAVEMIPKMWRDEPFSWKGKYYDIPSTHIVPKPKQQHPPVFAACSRPELTISAGKKGLGALTFTFYKDENLKQKIIDYREAIKVAEPITDVITNHFCCNTACLVLKDDKKAFKYGIRGSKYFTRSFAHYYWTENSPLSPANAESKIPSTVNATSNAPSDKEVELIKKYRNSDNSQLTSVIGDPVSARESIQRFVDVGADELIFVLQAGTVPHEIIMESIRTIGEEVIPHFK
jgi:alkanesulfonate monooxygenase SsuD/methylene tetrahydromethanopterin reductase-like flavin-dependent oxidoreductase (luciferase family)